MRQVLQEQFTQLRVSSIQKLAHEQADKQLNVLAHIHAPAVITPRQIRAIEKKLGEKSSGYSLPSWSVERLGDKYYAFFEVKGPKMMTLDTVRSLKSELSASFDLPLEIFVRSVPEAVLTEHGYTNLENLLARFGERTRDVYDQETMKLIETWR